MLLIISIELNSPGGDFLTPEAQYRQAGNSLSIRIRELAERRWTKVWQRELDGSIRSAGNFLHWWNFFRRKLLPPRGGAATMAKKPPQNRAVNRRRNKGGRKTNGRLSFPSPRFPSRAFRDSIAFGKRIDSSREESISHATAPACHIVRRSTHAWPNTSFTPRIRAAPRSNVERNNSLRSWVVLHSLPRTSGGNGW